MSDSRWSPEEALQRRVIREELAPIREELAVIRDELTAVVDLLADALVARRTRIEESLNAKKWIDWLDTEVGRAAVNRAIGNRSTAGRWANGTSKTTTRADAESLLRKLGLDPVSLPADEMLADHDAGAAA